MSIFIIRRASQAVVVLLGVTIATFALEHLIPGNLARGILGDRASAASIAAFDRINGLEHPVVVQYLVFLGHLVRGNLGFSYRLDQSVDSLILRQLPYDLVLVGSSLMIAIALAIPLGVLQAADRNSAFDHGVSGVALTLYSTPAFVIALVLIAWLAISWHVLPSEAPQASSLAGILGHPSGLVLPVATQSVVTLALFSRYMRSSAVSTFSQDFVRSARAKGLPERSVMTHHVVRNSLLSVTTLIGLSLPGVITTGLVVEYVFNFPGIGLSYYTAALDADYPVELGVTVVVAVLTVFGNLIADIAYAFLDPRIRYS